MLQKTAQLHDIALELNARFKRQLDGEVKPLTEHGAFQQASTVLMQLIRSKQDAPRRGWVQEHWKEIDEEWYEQMYRQQLAEDADWQDGQARVAYRHMLSKLAQWEQDGDPDEALNCHGVRGIHHLVDASLAQKDLHKDRAL
ncbi:unnamed protein product [Parajaminaea phylloscopi]